MLVQILKDNGIFSEGDIVLAKRFKDFTEDEKHRETCYLDAWNGNEIFAKRPTTGVLGEEYLYMYDEEVIIINE